MSSDSETEFPTTSNLPKRRVQSEVPSGSKQIKPMEKTLNDMQVQIDEVRTMVEEGINALAREIEERQGVTQDSVDAIKEMVASLLGKDSNSTGRVPDGTRSKDRNTGKALVNTRRAESAPGNDPPDSSGSSSSDSSSDSDSDDQSSESTPRLTPQLNEKTAKSKQ